jgi:hypothetical protein
MSSPRFGPSVARLIGFDNSTDASKIIATNNFFIGNSSSRN